MIGRDTHAVKIVDPDTHELCEPNQVGEIWVKQKTMMKGYLNRPEENAKFSENKRISKHSQLKEEGIKPSTRGGPYGLNTTNANVPSREIRHGVIWPCGTRCQ